MTRAHRPRRTRDEMRAAIERRIREQDPLGPVTDRARLDLATERELAAALGAAFGIRVRGRHRRRRGVLGWLTTYTKGPR